jgi:hypothetical protein
MSAVQAALKEKTEEHDIVGQTDRPIPDMLTHNEPDTDSTGGESPGLGH